MGTYRMKAVSQMTGIRSELLRMWERRYGLFKPQRAGNRYREFDDEDVRLLLYLREQIEAGRSIGELASEGREALLRRITKATEPGERSAPTVVDELLQAAHELDKRQLDARLAELIACTPFLTLLTTVLTPVMHRLGDAWTRDETSIASVLLMTELIRARLLAMLQSTAPHHAAPVLLCACLPGESHELGLLTFAYTMQQEGWHAYYLGCNLPLAALQEAGERIQPALVALSLTYAPDAARSMATLHQIDAGIAALYPTCIGGQIVEGHAHLESISHLQICRTLAEAKQYGRRLQTSGLLAIGTHQVSNTSRHFS
jgi:methanogenic corrinoid protein MtbC1